MALEPDCKCKVIHSKSGYAKDNTSWIVGRIVRDFPYWRHPDVTDKLNEVLNQKHAKLIKEGDPKAERPLMAGLVVSIYEPSKTIKAGRVKSDLVYWIGVPVMMFQLGLAAIPCGLFGDWGIILITGCGIVLSISTGLLPQWAEEKWACRKNSKHSVILTRGNGAQHAIVIMGNGHGLYLEDLASGQSNARVETKIWTRFALGTLATLWIFLLITAAGQKANTWFLLAIGGSGILQNVYVAGAQRKPQNFGVPLEYVTVFGNYSVMETLLQVEEYSEGVGRSMLGEFFPGDLRNDEKVKWAALKKAQVVRKKENAGLEKTDVASMLGKQRGLSARDES